jgi:transcriptional repressor NrdR
MKCPFCESPDTSVIDSREAEDGKIVRRRRECASCKARFTTYERPELTDIVVLKRKGEKENYQREKIESGVKKALEKRPVTDQKIEEMVDTIESEIFAKNKNIISSREIGCLVIEELEMVDKVACLRFLSVYRSFGSLESFNKEIKKLKRKKDGRKSKNKKR